MDSDSVKRKLLKFIEENRVECIDFLKKLISFNTEVIDYGKSGNELEAQKYIAEYLNKLNFKVDVFEPDNNILKKYKDCSTDHDYKDRPNVVGVLKGYDKGKSLILNGHIDTVPAAPLEKWKHNPYEGVIDKGKLYGRGTVDMKAGIAGMIMAVKFILENKVKLKGDVIIESVVDEEGDGNGTMACCDKYQADGAIVTEPTSLKILPANTGAVILEIKTKGISKHACSKYSENEGINAIDKMLLLLNEIDKFEKEKIIYNFDIDYYPKIASISVCTIEGGNSIATFPEDCVAGIMIEYYASEADSDGFPDTLKKVIEDRVRMIEKSDEWLSKNPSDIKWIGTCIPYKMDKNNELVTSLSDSYNYAIKAEAKLGVLPTYDEASHLFHYAKTPVISFGPGDLYNAHMIDEFIDLEEYIDFIKVLAIFIIDWCEI